MQGLIYQIRAMHVMTNLLYPADQSLIWAGIHAPLKWRHMSAKASQITGNSSVCSSAYSV